jgi:hypothetical protein
LALSVSRSVDLNQLQQGRGRFVSALFVSGNRQPRGNLGKFTRFDGPAFITKQPDGEINLTG